MIPDDRKEVLGLLHFKKRDLTPKIGPRSMYKKGAARSGRKRVWSRGEWLQGGVGDKGDGDRICIASSLSSPFLPRFCKESITNLWGGTHSQEGKGGTKLGCACPSPPPPFFKLSSCDTFFLQGLNFVPSLYGQEEKEGRFDFFTLRAFSRSL